MAIPKVIHFIWTSASSTADDLPADMKRNIAAWEAVEPRYQRKVWLKEDLRGLLGGDFYGLQPWDCMEICRFEAMKADIARLALIYEFGGFWSDLKNVPLVPFLDELAKRDEPFLVDHAPTTKLPHLSNSFFGTPPKHRFFLNCLAQACSNVTSRSPDNSVFWATGPALIKRVLDEWKFAAPPLDVFPQSEVWNQHGQNPKGWMKRTGASYNGADMKNHWSVRQKVDGLYLPGQTSE